MRADFLPKVITDLDSDHNFIFTLSPYSRESERACQIDLDPDHDFVHTLSLNFRETE
jgi:hypothetical protein